MQQEQCQEKFLGFSFCECPVLSNIPPESYHCKSRGVLPLKDTTLKRAKKTLNNNIEK